MRMRAPILLATMVVFVCTAAMNKEIALTPKTDHELQVLLKGRMLHSSPHDFKDANSLRDAVRERAMDPETNLAASSINPSIRINSYAVGAAYDASMPICTFNLDLQTMATTETTVAAPSINPRSDNKYAVGAAYDASCTEARVSSAMATTETTVAAPSIYPSNDNSYAVGAACDASMPISTSKWLGVSGIFGTKSSAARVACYVAALLLLPSLTQAAESGRDRTMGNDHGLFEELSITRDSTARDSHSEKVARKTESRLATIRGTMGWNITASRRRLSIPPCPDGYSDSTGGSARNWACGTDNPSAPYGERGNCAGGAWTDGSCHCACQLLFPPSPLPTAEPSQPCSAGTYCPDEGSTSEDGILCSSGSYCPAGSVEEVPCPAGSFCETPDVIAPCSAGTYCPNEGSTSDDGISCSSGSYCAAGSVEEVPCSPGSYNDGSGTKPCPSGTAAGAQSDPGLRYFGFDQPPSATEAGVVMHNFDDPATAESGWSEEGQRFDGVNDYVELPTWPMGGAMSFELYFKYRGSNGYGYEAVFEFFDRDVMAVSSTCRSNMDAGEIFLRHNTESEAELRLTCGGASVIVSSFWVVNEWAHIVATVDTSRVQTLYKNGEYAGSAIGAALTTFAIRSKQTLGRAEHYDPTNREINGTLRYFAVYDRALGLADLATATTTFKIGLAGAITIAACEACPLGRESSPGGVGGAACQPVSPGSYNDGSGTTKPCPSGTAAGAQSDPGLRYFGFDQPSSATEAGAVYHNFADPATAESGWSEEGQRFDGVDDYMELPTLSIGGAMSFEFYARWNVFVDWARIFDTQFAETSSSSVIFLANQGSTASIKFGNYQTGQISSNAVEVDNFIQEGAFLHVIAVITETGQMMLYKDGSFVGTNTGRNPFVQSKMRFQLGWGFFGNTPLDGVIRYFAVYDRALTLADQASATTTFKIGLAGATTVAACEAAICAAGFYFAHPNRTVGVCAKIDDGHYGATIGLLVSTGDGLCSPGFWCADGSTTPTQSLCDAGYHCPTGSSNATGVGECGQGFFCTPGQARAERSPGFCTYRTDGASDLSGIKDDAQAPCGRLAFDPATLAAATTKPLKTEVTAMIRNAGGLPLTWRLDRSSVPPWMLVQMPDEQGDIRGIKDGNDFDFDLAAGESVELTLVLNSADTDTDDANLTVLQTQAWPNPGEPAAAVDLPVKLPVAFEVQRGNVLLLPQENFYAVEVNQSLPPKNLVLYNLQQLDLEWSARLEGDNVSSWLSASPTSGTLNGMMSGGETTTGISLAMGAMPEQGMKPGPYRAALVLTDLSTGNEQQVPISLEVSPGPANAGQSAAAWDEQALRLPSAPLQINTNDAFRFPTSNALETVGSFDVTWALISGECLAPVPCGGMQIVALQSTNGKLGFRTIISPEANGTYAFNVTNNGVHVRNSPFHATFAPSLCSKPNEQPTPGTGKGCVCEQGFERKPGGACGPCKQGSEWRGFGQSCEPCGAGTREVMGVCEDCQAGSRSEAGQTQCTPCEQGFVERSNACAACSPGRRENGDRTSCEPCLAGAISEAGQTQCTRCAQGFVERSNVCEACSPGTRENGNRTSCKQCEAGKISSVGQIECAPCEAGTAENGIRTACDPCAAGDVSDARQTSCTPCDAGSKAVTNACELCEAGTVQSEGGQLECEQCPEGFFQAERGQTECVRCPSLIETPNDDGRSCKACPLGSTVDPTDPLWRCEPCDAGTARLDANGSATCAPCLPGHISEAGQMQCEPCDAGAISDAKGVACIPCLPSQYVVDNFCVCDDEHFPAGGGGACVACPEGGECVGGVTAATVAPRPGYWKTPWDPLVFVPCRDGDACTVNSTAGAYDSVCGEGHFGPLCQACEAGYTRSGSACVTCYDQSVQMVIFVLCLGFGVVVAVLLIRTTLQTAANPSRLEVQMLKIVASHLQLVAMARSFPLRWPAWVVTMFAAFDFASSAGESALAFECLDAEAVGGAKGRSPFIVMASLLLALPLLCAAAAAAFWGGLKRWRRGRAASSNSGATDGAYVNGFVVTNVVLLFLLHPILTRTGFRFFTCSTEDMGGPTFLEADFSMECWQSTHLGWALALGAPLLALYAVGVPLLAFRLLVWAQRQGLDEWRPVLGFVFNGFEPRFFFWECVIMSRKLVFAFIAVVLRPIGVDIQAYTGLGVIAVSMMLQLKFAPYTDPKINRMELLGLMVSFAWPS